MQRVTLKGGSECFTGLSKQKLGPYFCACWLEIAALFYTDPVAYMLIVCLVGPLRAAFFFLANFRQNLTWFWSWLLIHLEFFKKKVDEIAKSVLEKYEIRQILDEIY